MQESCSCPKCYRAAVGLLIRPRPRPYFGGQQQSNLRRTHPYSTTEIAEASAICITRWVSRLVLVLVWYWDNQISRDSWPFLWSKQQRPNIMSTCDLRLPWWIWVISTCHDFPPPNRANQNHVYSTLCIMVCHTQEVDVKSCTDILQKWYEILKHSHVWIPVEYSTTLP